MPVAIQHRYFWSDETFVTSGLVHMRHKVQIAWNCLILARCKMVSLISRACLNMGRHTPCSARGPVVPEYSHSTKSNVPCIPITLLIITMCPLFFFFMSGNISFSSLTSPKKFVSITVFISSMVWHSMGPISPIPALLTVGNKDLEHINLLTRLRCYFVLHIVHILSIMHTLLSYDRWCMQNSNFTIQYYPNLCSKQTLWFCLTHKKKYSETEMSDCVAWYNNSSVCH